jgi:uncharacterized protein (TIGR04255 family)
MEPPARPADLPDFLRPPVSEVALSIQFEALQSFRSAHIGLLWQRVRDQYPKISEQAPLPAAFETFGSVPVIAPTRPIIEALMSPPMPRFWFESLDSRDLLQIQQDRIIQNWRRREAEEEYPRYETIRGRFLSNVEKFVDLLRSEMIGELRPNQCEVTYVNAVETPGGESPDQQLQRITPLWAGRFSEPYPLEVENTILQTRLVLRDQGRPYGRAYVSFAPGILPADNRPVLRLDITVRGKPRDQSISEAFRSLDDEREVVVRTFAAVTTPAMWEIWGRTNAK